MVFASMTFLWIFLPVALCLYYILQLFKCIKAQNILLLIMSLVFYSFGEPRYILLLVVCVFANYISGLLIAKCSGILRKIALAMAVVISLSLLAYFKYIDFLVGTINMIASKELLKLRNVALPIGISFYTFQALSYSIDLYRGKCKVQRSFLKLLLYISFFPQLIAGPIVRYRDVSEQIDHRVVNVSKFSEGVNRFICGLCKKVLLANTFASRVDMVFALQWNKRTALMSWFGIILYAMQIYLDFSGYSDMAIGLGKMFGFDFLENFDMPYISMSVREFWRRWHISLSTWFKEYLYIPLGGNRKGTVRTYINLFIVFFVTGLWHGAGWTFIAWGLFHGFFMIAERMFLGKYLELNRYKIMNHIYTILVILFAWVFFRANNINEAVFYFKSMFSCHKSNLSFVELFGVKCLVFAVVGALLCVVIPFDKQRELRQRTWFKLLALPLMLFICIVVLASDSYNPFIYFRF